MISSKLIIFKFHFLYKMFEMATVWPQTASKCTRLASFYWLIAHSRHFFADHYILASSSTAVRIYIQHGVEVITSHWGKFDILIKKSRKELTSEKLNFDDI